MRRRLPEGVREKTRASGRLAYEARWRDRLGDRHSRTFDTVDEAAIHLAAQAEALRVGGSADPTGGRTLLTDWLREWWSDRARLSNPEVRASTSEMHHNYIAARIVPALGRYRLDQLTTGDINDWVSEMLAPTNGQTKMAPASALKALQILALALDAAVDEGLIPVSPATRVRRPKIPDTERRFLTPAALVVAEAAMPEWWRLTVPFMADTACRIGELSAVRVSHIRVDVMVQGRTVAMDPIEASGHWEQIVGATALLQKSAAEVSRKFSKAATIRVEGNMKSRAAYRPVPTVTRTTARRIVGQVLERELELDDHLFSGTRGGALLPRAWRKNVFARAMAASGLAEPLPTPHALRHTGISRWIASGVHDVYKLAAWAGHRTPATIARTYAHVLPHNAADTRLALEAMAQEALDAWTDNDEPPRV